MFDIILRHLVAQGKLHERSVHDFRCFTEYLENQTDYTRGQLQRLIQRINHRTVEPHEKFGPHVIQLLRDLGEYGLMAETLFHLKEGGLLSEDVSDIVKPQRESEKTCSEQHITARNTIDIDSTRFPVSQQNYYDKYYEEALFYAWLAFLWQEVEGYCCGLKVMTLENNSSALFSLNDFSHEFLSAYIDYDQTGTPSYIEPVFPRKLSLVELFNRASFYPIVFNLYENYWRYFEKGGQFCEIVTYEFATGLRSGAVSENKTAQVTDIKQHENPRAALEHLATFTNQAILDGWEEKLRPLGLPDRMHDKAFDFNFSTGPARFEKREKANRLKAEDIRQFELNHELKLPESLAEYLRIFNGRQNNTRYMAFPVDDLMKVTVKQFHTLKELGDAALLTIQRRPDIIWIGILSDDALIGVRFQSNDTRAGDAETFGRMAINRRGQITICDYSFDKFAQYAQDL